VIGFVQCMRKLVDGPDPVSIRIDEKPVGFTPNAPDCCIYIFRVHTPSYARKQRPKEGGGHAPTFLKIFFFFTRMKKN
jgi:hypothetical protein